MSRVTFRLLFAVLYETVPVMVAALVLDSPKDIVILLTIVIALAIGVPLLIYRHGRKVGDSQGYMRGYKDGQESLKK